MPEQFGINRPFRYSTAIHCNIRSMLPPAELMDNLRKTFFSHTALACHQNRQVCRRDLHGYINGTVQPLGISDNAKPQLHILNLCLIHISKYSDRTKIQKT